MRSCPGLTLNSIGYTTSKTGEQIANKRSTAIVDHLEANYGDRKSTRLNSSHT